MFEFNFQAFRPAPRVLRPNRFPRSQAFDAGQAFAVGLRHASPEWVSSPVGVHIPVCGPQTLHSFLIVKSLAHVIVARLALADGCNAGLALGWGLEALEAFRAGKRQDRSLLAKCR